MHENVRFLTLSSLRRHFTPSTVWLGGVIPLKSGGLEIDFMDDSSELTLYKDPVFNLGRLCLNKITKRYKKYLYFKKYFPSYINFYVSKRWK